jgi:uncharacterized protein YdiU (UPF0061 family)
MLRYAYRNQPSIIWWNLVRLGESLGELIGAGNRVNNFLRAFDEFWFELLRHPVIDEAFVVNPVSCPNLIERVGEEFKAVFLNEYKRLMGQRLGLKTQAESDFQTPPSPRH